MAALTALAIGGALGAGFLFGRKSKGPEEQYQLTRDPSQPMAGSSSSAATQRRTAQQQVAATKPVDAVQAQSQNTASALQVAAKTRRRAAAGNAGTIKLPVSAQQRSITPIAGAKTLVGY